MDAKLWIFTGQAASLPSPVIMSSDQNNEITDINGRNGLSLRDRARPVEAHMEHLVGSMEELGALDVPA